MTAIDRARDIIRRKDETIYDAHAFLFPLIEELVSELTKENMKTVYLAGPITGLNFAGATDWREHARAVLGEQGITGLSPLRGKEYLASLPVLSGHGKEYAHMGVLSQSRGVITRDRFDCTRCDVLLVNLLGAKSVSVGTVMEIAWADLVRTPIVCAIEESGNPHEHMMVNEAIGYRLPSLEEALHVIGAILK